VAGRDFALPWVQRALRSGIGPTEALRQARAGGLRIQDSNWFRAYGQERANIALQIRARDAPLNRRPSADEIGRWDTVRRRGFATRVTALATDRLTGAKSTIHVTVTTPRLVSRGRAISAAMDAWQDPEEKYPKLIQAAFVSGVFEMVPGEAEE